MSYAEGTSVPVERSRAEIESTLRRYGADSFLSGWQDRKAMVQFRAHGRFIRFVMTMPDPGEERFTRRQTKYSWVDRGTEEARRLHEQACRTCWRALCLVIKAKLEAVASGITTFEAEFLAHVVLPTGETVGSWLSPQLDEAYATGAMPAFLPMLPAPGETDKGGSR